MDIIGQEIDFYKTNRLNFIDLHGGKHLAIKGMQIIGIYNTKTEAYEETIKLHETGTFIIEHPLQIKPRKVTI